MSISESEFTKAVESCGYSRPSSEIYRHFADSTRNFSRNETAMFLAQLIHESGGFQFKEEIAFKGKRNHGAYVDSVGLPGRDYHGRGFIQLTWGANYKAASEALGLGDKLLKNPELVAENTKMAMMVSDWYWKDRVKPEIRGREDCFGLTTRAINGAIECSGGFNRVAHQRYKNYLKVADAMGIRDKAKETGCYN